MKKMIFVFGVQLISIIGFAQCIQQVKTGKNHIVVLDDKGYLWTGGSNESGELGDGTVENKKKFHKIGDMTWKQIFVREGINLAIRSDGTLWGWGSNFSGQLGDGTKTSRLSPVQIGTDNNWKSISIGSYHCMGLKTDGTLWGWGLNEDKQLGSWITNIEELSPVQIGTDSTWTNVFAGIRSNRAVKEDGSLWKWGLVGEPDLKKVLVDGIKQVGTEYNWKRITGTERYFFGYKTDGTLWRWGSNEISYLGGENGNLIKLNDAKLWVELVYSDYDDHALMIKDDGSLWSVGDNNFGQLGDGTTERREHFIQIGNEHKWKAVAVGENFSAAISEDNRLFTWGANDYGQLVDGKESGDGPSLDEADRVLPNQVGTEVCLLGTHDSNLKKKIMVYPNPTHRDITIDFGEVLFEAATATVYNSLGQIVSQKTIQKPTEIVPIEGTSGVYFVKINFPNGETINHTVLKK
ncbi:T9SS type A sorting domain-containing protein [Flavobacterium sp.]|uniref:T9SS type A sorting domain-containing protein n=1 Tax=Flavobacterium sp. TaxID=239 RepID=UPI00261D937B|nr:T9SS type A sorting domain-containing protein [Flavobacterium sp.]